MRKIWAKTIAMVIVGCMLCTTPEMNVLAQGSVSDSDVINVEQVLYAEVNEKYGNEIVEVEEIPSTAIATTDEEIATCKVTVTVPSTKVKLNKTSVAINKGKSYTLKGKLTPGSSTDTITWSSSNTKVATVSAKGVVKAVSKGTATITAKTTSGKKATCKVTVKVPATKVKLNKTKVSIYKGKTYTLKGKLTPSNSTDTIKWSSSNTKVATVSKKGVVKALSRGTATITAKTTSGKKATCKVTVKVSATKVKLNKTQVSIDQGNTYILKGTLTPGNSTDTIKWRSSNTKIATVSDKGVVTAVSKGTATITAKTTSGKTATCKVTVTVPATKVNLDKTSVVIYEGNTYTLKGTLTPSDSTDTITWSSSNTKVATVSDKGIVTAVANGTVTITAKATSGKQKTCKVTVKEPYVNAKTKELIVDKTFTLKLSGATAVSFESGDSNIATVSSTGKIQAKNVGETTITITDEDGRTYTCIVTVIKDPYSSEEIYAAMVALQEDYPEGMPWTNADFYAWKGGIYSGGYGCAGFAFILSDAAFGDLPARTHTDFSKMKVGDILRLNYDGHSVVILEVKEDSVIVAEGNYNRSIHWGREISFSYIEQTGTYVMTRYPE